MTSGEPVRPRHDPECPRCHSEVCRAPRRFVDSVLSLFIAVHRYRCGAMGCSWEGNLRVRDVHTKAVSDIDAVP